MRLGITKDNYRIYNTVVFTAVNVCSIRLPLFLPIWTHFSIYEVWDNIREEEIRELEGIFRHIYRLNSRANRLNKQRTFKKLKKIQDNNLKNWNK